MITAMQIAAGLVMAFGAGILVGNGFTTHALDRSFRRLAHDRRLLDERERVLQSTLTRHHMQLSHVGAPSRRRQSVHRTPSRGDPPDDDD